MCCFDQPLPGPRKPSMKDRAQTALWKAKFNARAVKGAALARAKKVGIRTSGERGPMPFGGRSSTKPA